MIGAGALAPHLVRAHRAVRPITRVTLWNRTRSRAISTAFALSAAGIEAEIADDLEAAVREADIVSCATLSPQPLVRGAWLKKGAHVDLVGAFTPTMREADDEAMRRARVYVDTRAGAPKGSGDIAIPLKKKVIALKDIQGDLFELCRGKAKGRKRGDEITLFKSVGIALEDLAAAMLVWRSVEIGLCSCATMDRELDHERARHQPLDPAHAHRSDRSQVPDQDRRAAAARQRRPRLRGQRAGLSGGEEIRPDAASGWPVRKSILADKLGRPVGIVLRQRICRAGRPKSFRESSEPV